MRGLRLGEPGIEEVDLGDQLVDALRDVLALLIGVEQLALEHTQAPIPILEIAPQRLVLSLQSLATFDEALDRPLQAIPVVRVALAGRNGVTPAMGRMLPSGCEVRQEVDAREGVDRLGHT